MGMIPASNLRIGNLFWESYGGYKIVAAINCNKVGDMLNTVSARAINGTLSGQFSCENIEPIPLTPDILIKCGFEREEDDENYERYRSSVHYPFDLFIENNEVIAIHYLGASLKKVPKYLHDFQNIVFASTDTELEINL